MRARISEMHPLFGVEPKRLVLALYGRIAASSRVNLQIKNDCCRTTAEWGLGIVCFPDLINTLTNGTELACGLHPQQVTLV